MFKFFTTAMHRGEAVKKIGITRPFVNEPC
jgi:hypothetical protein